jgi:hypothetical protein
MAKSLAGSLLDELLLLFDPLTMVASPAGVQAMLASFGHTGQITGQTSLNTALNKIAASIGELSQIDETTLTTWEGVEQLLRTVSDIFTAVRSVESAITDPALLAQVKGLGEQIANRLVALYLRTRVPSIYQVAALLTLVTPAETAEPSSLQVVNGQIVRMPWADDDIHLERVNDLINNPWPTLRNVYFPNNLAQTIDAYNAANQLLPLLRLLTGALGLPSASDLFPLTPTPDADDSPSYGDDSSGSPTEDNPPVVDDLEAIRLQSMPRLVARLPGLDGSVQFAIAMTISSKAHPDGVAGLIFSLESGTSWSETLGNWKLDFAADGQVPAFVIGPNGVSLAPIAGPLTGATGSFTITRLSSDTSGGAAFLFGSATGTRIELGSVQAGITFALSPTAQTIGLSAGVQKAALVIAAGDGDGFLSAVLPSDGLRADFDLTILVSSQTGLSIRGAAGLDTTLPIGISLGSVAVPTIHLALLAGASGLSFETSASISLSIGPVKALVDQIGLLTKITFPSGGNLGPVDFALGFKPPSGVGLSIDSAGVSGGGFLGFSPGQYSGVLQLKFNDLALQAFGLITTQVAGGQGYSLLALIDADFPPIQLGWGFTLNGVGGLLAVHRTASVDALHAAVKSGKVSSILFPTNPISNASQILGALETLFPTAPGRFLFGPMALIGWGTPNVLTASIAVILELPEPIEIILLAKLTAQLPNPSASLIKLNMDALGVLDLTQDNLSLDASLFDSKLISYPITGDMALRANWSSQREFLLAIGGFHPQFTPPSDFPTLNRVAINMPSGIVSRLRLAAYLAITSNSVQFGATLDVFIGAPGYGISGHLGFDALLQLDPFHFTADISGSVAVTIGGDDLASVSLDASLTGPAPWNIAGSFKIHVIFFDVHKSFSESWGLSAPSQQTSTVDVGALLNTALADPRNWSSQLPAGLSALVTTRKVDDASFVFAYPLAVLEVHEQIVPLGLTITRFGEAVPSGATEFSITDFRVGSERTTPTAVQDDFAPAQFFDLSDNDKLSRPSFERHDAGAIMSGTLVTNGNSFAKPIDYESFFINTPGIVTVDEGVPQPFPWGDLQIVMRTGSAALKTISQAGKLRYAAPGNPITVAEPVFSVASASVLTAVTTPPAAGTTYSDAAAALKSALTRFPNLRDTLQIVASHELVKGAA